MIRFGLKSDMEPLMALCKEAYPVKDQMFYEYYFTNVYKDGDALIQELDNKLVSQIHNKERVFNYKNKKMNVSFLLGICTHYDYRNRKMMAQLMDMTLEDVSNKYLLSFVEARNPKMMEKYGFEILTYRRRYVVYAQELLHYKASNVSEMYDPAAMKIVYDRFVKIFDGYFTRDISYFEQIVERAILEDMKICVHQDHEGNYDGYAIYIEKDEGIEIKEILYLDSKILIKLVKFAIGYTPFITIEVSKSERLDKIFKMSIPRDLPAVMVRINDLKLFNKLYNRNFKNTKEFVSNIQKPIWINDRY